MGMNRYSGKALGTLEHLRQSVLDILTTPVGSRVMRRDYGSELFRLVDAPLNEVTKMALRVATVDALERWEPRLRVEQVRISANETGVCLLDLLATVVDSGATFKLEGLRVA